MCSSDLSSDRHEWVHGRTEPIDDAVHGLGDAFRVVTPEVIGNRLREGLAAGLPGSSRLSFGTPGGLIRRGERDLHAASIASPWDGDELPWSRPCGPRGLSLASDLLYVQKVRFDWDDRKASSNLAKHGVSFDEAITAFDDPFALVAPDPRQIGRAHV